MDIFHKNIAMFLRRIFNNFTCPARSGIPMRGNFLSDVIYAKAQETYVAIEELSTTSILAAELEQILKDGLNIDDILSGKKK